jgi:hypothetical protein
MSTTLGWSGLSRIGAAVAAVASIGLLTACGTDTVDPKSEVALAKKALTAIHAPATKSINCQSGVPLKVGKTAVCHITLVQGAPITLTMKVDKVTSNGGHMTIIKAKQG